MGLSDFFHNLFNKDTESYRDTEQLKTGSSVVIRPEESGNFWICEKCGSRQPGDFLFCNRCGARRPERVPSPDDAAGGVRCTCGYVFKEEEKFCRRCGKPRPEEQVQPVCECGHVFEPDEYFCVMCGRPRPEAEHPEPPADPFAEKEPLRSPASSAPFPFSGDGQEHGQDSPFADPPTEFIPSAQVRDKLNTEPVTELFTVHSTVEKVRPEDISIKNVTFPAPSESAASPDDADGTGGPEHEEQPDDAEASAARPDSPAVEDIQDTPETAELPAEETSGTGADESPEIPEAEEQEPPAEPEPPEEHDSGIRITIVDGGQEEAAETVEDAAETGNAPAAGGEEPEVCPSCGAALQSGANFCIYCGARIH